MTITMIPTMTFPNSPLALRKIHRQLNERILARLNSRNLMIRNLKIRNLKIRSLKVRMSRLVGPIGRPTDLAQVFLTNYV